MEVCWYHISGEYPATHYVRHYCPSCQKLEIVAVCAICHDYIKSWLERHGKYPWECDGCDGEMERAIVGKV
jgi:hypothetical protein